MVYAGCITTTPPRATDHAPFNKLENRTKGMKTVLVFYSVFNPLHSVVVNERRIMYTWSNINHVRRWLLADVLTMANFPETYPVVTKHSKH